MKIAYCTIITPDYINYALTLNHSLLKFKKNIQLKVFVSDNGFNHSYFKNRFPNIEFYFPEHVCTIGSGKRIYNKYIKTSMDCFRWSMKPVFIMHLLSLGFDQVFFLDSDLYFFSAYDFLSQELVDHSLLLSPHWRSFDPNADRVNFSILQTSGLFNAGFLGVSQKGIPAMEWWANVCEDECKKAPERGLFNDQAYLDLMPIYFENVKILRHKGCNVANWNQVECKRTVSSDQRITINYDQEIVFIHFTSTTINGIYSGQDSLLIKHLEEYKKKLESFKKWIPNNLAGVNQHTLPKNKIVFLGKNDFTSPICIPRTLDNFVIRNTILDLIKTHLYQFKGILLDVGCGQMPYKSLVTSPPSQVTEYLGLDFKNNPIHNNRPDITWQNGKIPLDDNSVDCAICTEVLEHCPEPNDVLNEICRVLKPGGRLFFTVPFLWPLHEVPYDHYRYTPFALERHLKRCGFDRIKLTPTGGWDASLAQMLGLWIRRRPMNRWIRSCLSYLCWPVVWWLSKLDNPEKVTFKESAMITGIAGTARKRIP